jgi:acetylornithine/N-succinyldiaminopimelate aminotransferase
MDTVNQTQKYIADTYKRADVVFVRGEGATLFDENGKEYIDFGSGIAVNALGYGNKKWMSAVESQLHTLQHVCNLFYSRPCAELAEKLCSMTGFKKVFFCNSGAEAVESAIKTAKKYGFEKRGIKYPKIITLTNSFHGRTAAAISATGQPALHKEYFSPYLDGFRYTDPDDFAMFKKKICKNTIAVMMELVQGESGVRALDKTFVKQVADYCAQKGFLLIIDEVQSGNGRTGTLYAYEQYGISPDIVTTAKGLGNGLPIGACLFNDKTADVLQKGDHGSTFGGNPVCAAGAISVLEQLDDKLLAGVNARAMQIREALFGLTKVKSVSGLGLMIGIEADGADALIEQCLKMGLLVLPAHGKIRLLPPLNISYDELFKGLNILKEVLK